MFRSFRSGGLSGRWHVYLSVQTSFIGRGDREYSTPRPAAFLRRRICDPRVSLSTAIFPIQRRLTRRPGNESCGHRSFQKVSAARQKARPCPLVDVIRQRLLIALPERSPLVVPASLLHSVCSPGKSR